jgi:hypothetical protein
MFAPEVSLVDGYWSASGTFADGQTADPLARVAPALEPQSPRGYSRWYKLRDNLIDRRQLQALLCTYLCRRLSAPPRLIGLTLTLRQRPTREVGGPPRPFAIVVDEPWRCR